MRKYLGVLFLLCFLSSACLISTDRTTFLYHHLSEKPSETEIVGTWIPDSSTLNEMKTWRTFDSSKLPKLIFKENGHFEMIDTPNWWNVSEGFNSTKGKWKLSNSLSQIWRIDIDFDNLVTDIGLKKNNFSDQPKFIIFSFIGDPDSGNVMVFTKEK